MHSPVPQMLLDQVLELIELARPLVEAVARRDRELASQLRRALNSVALNAAEAFGSSGGNARLRFETARGSLYEARTGLRVATAWGYLTAASCAPALAVMDRVAARIFGFCRS